MCDECGAQAFLATLPPSQGKQAVHVFRCDGCDLVVSERHK